MNDQVRSAAEGIARKTSRRGFFSRGADLAFGALIGAAAGTATRGDLAGATDFSTHCAFPGPPCPCDGCLRPDGVTTNGVCAKPCVINTTFYPGGCWTITPAGKGTITCCDCDCTPETPSSGWCGCGSDYHNNPQFCPQA